MKVLCTPFLTIAVFLKCGRSDAQPANDECTDAVIIPSTPTFSYINTILNFQNATEGANDPLLSCLSFPSDNSTSFPATVAPSASFPPVSVNKASIWYSWTPSIGGSFDFIAVGGSDLFGIISPSIGILEGASCDDTLEEVACSFGLSKSVNISAGSTYFIFVEFDIYDDPLYESLVANMTLTVQPTPPPPPNDECVTATVIPSDAVFPYTTAAVELAQATENPNDPFLTCNIFDVAIFDAVENSTAAPSSTIAPSFLRSDGKTVWYSWTPAESGFYDFSTVGSRDVFGYEIYSAIGLFEGGDSCEEATEIECQTSGKLSGSELIGGTTYHIKVGAFVEYGTLILTVSLTPPPPPNDECVNATVIPSAPTFPYSTAPVALAQATENPSDPFLSCNFITNEFSDNSTLAPSTIVPSFTRSDGKTVWYIWTPLVSGSYDFYTTGSLDSYGSELYTTIGIYEGNSCDDTEEIKCKNNGRLRGSELKGGTTYRIKVGAYVDDGSLILSVKPTPPSPSNDACVGAIPIDPRSEVVSVTGDITDAFLDTALEGTCFSLDESSGLWYKIDNSAGDVLGIIASTCGEDTTFDSKISIFKGDDCGSTLECVGWVDDSPDDGCGLSAKISFLANEATTYWILVHGFGSSYGNFSLFVDSVASFLSLIDADSDSAIELLGDFVNYGSIRTPSLNIEASFSDDLPVESVRLTFDNPKRSFCKGTAPFSVFGDSNGNYFGKSLLVGSHLVTATAFSEANCQGTARSVLSQSFEVLGCSTYFTIYDATNSSTFVYLDPFSDTQVPSLPCELNIEAGFYCGFEVDGVRMELRDTSSDTVVSSRTDMVPPYFLFGDSNNNIASSSIAPGTYSITVWIDGIQHLPLNFTVVDACF